MKPILECRQRAVAALNLFDELVEQLHNEWNVWMHRFEARVFHWSALQLRRFIGVDREEAILDHAGAARDDGSILRVSGKRKRVNGARAVCS